MAHSFNSFLAILLFGSLLLLTFLLISNPLKVNRNANRYLGIFALLWATFWTEEILLLIQLDIKGSFFWATLPFFQFLAPVFFYFGVRNFTNPFIKISLSDTKFLVAPLLFLVPLTLLQYGYFADFMDMLLPVTLIGHALFYIFLSYLALNQHSQRLELFRSHKTEIDLHWIKRILFALTAIAVFMALYNLLVPSATSLNIIANIFMVIIVFYVAYNILKQKEIFAVNESQYEKVVQKVTDAERSTTKLIPDQQMLQWKQDLTQLMQLEKPYLQQELSLSDLSKKLSLTPHQLSYLLNKGFNQNFYSFINQHRIEAAKQLLLNEQYNHLSIVGIGFEAGFNSKTSFNTVFKKMTGFTPTQYRKQGSNS